MDFQIRVKRLHEKAMIPERMSKGAAGFDLYSCHPEKIIVLEPGKRALVPTGIALEIPEGFEGQVRSRSGLAACYGLITVLNSPGTIDSDYRGEIQVIAYNSGLVDQELYSGIRIAQIIFARVAIPELVEAEGSLSGTERGAAGIGSTGMSAVFRYGGAG